MKITKMTRNRQVTIPKEICEEMNVSEGDTFKVTADKGVIRLYKVKLMTEKEIKEMFREIDRTVGEKGVQKKEIKKAVEEAKHTAEK